MGDSVKKSKATYQMLKDTLVREHRRSCWGCLLVFRDDFKGFYNGGLCLDVGCNVGFLAGMVGEDRYVGLDIVTYDKRPPYFVLGDGQRLPFKDGAFGFVSMIETLEHLPDPCCALSEVERVLKAGGRAFIQSVHGEDPCGEGDPTHFQSFHRWSLQRLLSLFFPRLRVEHRGGSLIAKVTKT